MTYVDFWKTGSGKNNMLHLLLLILKIAGIILLIILGILILLLSVVLFVPVCYQVSAKTDGTAKGTKVRCKITWLFSLLELKILYKDKASAFCTRVAWKRIKGGEKPDDEEEKITENNEKEKSDTNLAAKEESEEADAPDEPAEQEIPKEEECEESNPYKVSEDDSTYEKEWSYDAQEDKSSAKKIHKAGQKISAFFQKIKCTIKGICDKINLFSERKEKLIQFLENELHRKAFNVAKRALIHLLKKIFPRKGRIFLRYGLEDPALTGTSLAGLAVLYPFFPGEFIIVPEFEEKVFEGKVNIQGKLYFIHFLIFALRLFVSRAVRQTYKDIRKFISEF